MLTVLLQLSLEVHMVASDFALSSSLPSTSTPPHECRRLRQHCSISQHCLRSNIYGVHHRKWLTIFQFRRSDKIAKFPKAEMLSSAEAAITPVH